MRALSDRETRTAHLWHRLFGSWAAAAVRRPRTTIALSLLVAAAALALSASHLTLKTSNLDLVDPGLPPVADFRAFAERFGTPNMLVVVLEGNDEATLHDAVDRVVEHARRAPGVRSVVGRLPYEPGDLALLGVDPYFAARDRRAFYVFVQPADAASSAQTIGPFAAAVRRAIAASGAAALGVRIGTTGLPQYALDDRTVIQHDISRLSALSFVVVLAVFALGFAEFMRPVLAMAGLTVAAAAMMGVAALAPGHLTLLSAFFLSALFGLGSDYGIFVIDAFEERLAAGEEKAAALVGAVRFLAPGLATETFATAAAFLTLAFSGFRGFAELGWIAAVGLLLSLLAMVVLLPALLVLHRGGGRRREKPLAARRLGRLLLALQHPALAAGLAALALAGLVAGLPGLRRRLPGAAAARLRGGAARAGDGRRLGLLAGRRRLHRRLAGGGRGARRAAARRRGGRRRALARRPRAARRLRHAARRGARGVRPLLRQRRTGTTRSTPTRRATSGIRRSSRASSRACAPSTRASPACRCSAAS